MAKECFLDAGRKSEPRCVFAGEIEVPACTALATIRASSFGYF